MLWDRDKQVIERLRAHQKGLYPRLNPGDVDYIILTIQKCAILEEKEKK